MFTRVLHQHHKGFTLLLSVLVASIVLAIGLAILSITLKEFQLSNIARESERALYAASAGLECALYWDRSSQGNKFDIGVSGAVTCMGDTNSVSSVGSGGTHELEFSWGGAEPVCANVEVTKYIGPDAPPGRTCPSGVECTIVVSRGYNKSCSRLTTSGTVERALRALY